jgi:hydroxyacylglutathione hydrolase
VLAHPEERVPGTTGDLHPGEEVTVGGLTVTALHTPGHTAGMLSLLVNGEVFTGDTLFKGSVGGVRAPGSTSFADIRHSIMDVLLALPPETVIRHGEGNERCTALGDPATLVLWGPDYDGGHKAWVRWADGSDDIVPGSRVER